MPDLTQRRQERLSRARRLAAPLMLCAALAIAGCGKSSHAGTNDGESATTSTAAADKSAQQLYESKRYAEAKALALRDAEQATGHDREVALLTAGLSAHAQGKYDEAVTILTPLTRSEDSRISGRAKSAIDYIGIDRGRAASASSQPAAAKAKKPGKEFTLQAGVFTSLGNAQKRANQLRPQAAKNGLGLPRIMPDSVNGANAYSVQVGFFPTRDAAKKAKDQFGNQVVVMPVD